MNIAMFTNDSKEACMAQEIIQPKIMIKEKVGENFNLPEIDLLVSYCYRYKIDKEVFSQPKYGGVNFHPAPLPKYRGFAVYNFGILNEENTWSVTAHCIHEKIDAGDIVMSSEFEIRENETVKSLRNRSHVSMLKMMPKVIENFHSLYENRSVQEGTSNYYSKNMMENFRRISDDDDPKMIDRKIRAFWMPPHGGAFVTIHGKEFTLINDDILKNL